MASLNGTGKKAVTKGGEMCPDCGEEPCVCDDVKSKPKDMSGDRLRGAPANPSVAAHALGKKVAARFMSMRKKK